MARNPGNATAVGAIDRVAVVRDIVAGNATDSIVAAARAVAVAAVGSSAVAANPADNGWHAVAVPAASYADASYCCGHDLNVRLCYHRDPIVHDGGTLVVAAADGAAFLVAAVVVAVANGLHAPVTGEPAPDVAVAGVVRAPATGGSDPAVAGRSAAAALAPGDVVPRAAAAPGCSAVAAGVAVPNAVAVAGCSAVAPAAVVPHVAAVPRAAVADLLRALAGGFVVLVVVAVGAARAGPGFPDSALRPGRVVPGH